MTAAVPAAPQPPPAGDWHGPLPELPPRWSAVVTPSADPLDDIGLPPPTVVRDADLNAGRPATWSGAVAPGGMVCAEPDDLTADGICGNPVESEPCDRRHEPPATVTPGQADPWAPGDRVTLSLPDKSAPYGRHVLVPGTVRDVDPPGLPTGVRVDLDWTVNGVSWCFATHGELRRLEVSHGR